jgi:hypothetical protein
MIFGKSTLKAYWNHASPKFRKRVAGVAVGGDQNLARARISEISVPAVNGVV